MYCQKCGQKMKAGTKFCPECGTAVEKGTKSKAKEEPKTATEQIYGKVETTSVDMNQLSKILSYFGIFFIVGLVSSAKDDRSVRFHVGQGIMLFLFEIVLNLLNVILTQFIFTPLFRSEIKIWGFVTGYEVSPLGQFLIGATWLATYGLIIYMIVRGVMSVIKNEDRELPVIGKFAFYR